MKYAISLLVGPTLPYVFLTKYLMSSFPLFSAIQPSQTSIFDKVWSTVKSIILFLTTPIRKIINYIFPNLFKNDSVDIAIYPLPRSVSIILM